ncbi:MAG TPA: formate dehydrogenase accessory sulfurtransferase FdhD [Allocoleopsis sp.]
MISKSNFKIWKIVNNHVSSCLDTVATEEPLEIRIIDPVSDTKQTLAITMRTPGSDFELAAGFIYNEGIINKRNEIKTMSYCVNPQLDGKQQQNIINIQFQANVRLDLPSLERHFFTTSACGVCGKASMESLKIKGCHNINTTEQIGLDIIYNLASQFNSNQQIFSKTGGLHAAALFNYQGQILKSREDVGRHNALDKLIGSELLADNLPLNNHIVMVSGRTSFEIVQKCIMAKVPIICGISAPSSLAVLLAQEFNITLIGFLRENRFNVYTGWERINL